MLGWWVVRLWWICAETRDGISAVGVVVGSPGNTVESVYLPNNEN